MAFGTPYLLSLGLSKQATSLVWLAGPLSGLLVQPIVGALSDASKPRWRRRFYIIIATFLIVSSTLVVAFAPWLAGVVGDVWRKLGKEDEGGVVEKRWTVGLAVLGFWILDFALNGCQAALRCLILDQAPSSQTSIANAWHGRFTHLGNLVGYTIGYLDLSSSPLLSWLGGGQFRRLAVLSCTVLVICVGITCFTQHEGNDDESDEGEDVKKDVGIGAVFKGVVEGVKSLPLDVKRVCIVQFFAWTAFFPFLFYSTTYIGQTLVLTTPRDQPPPSTDDATRLGSLALLFYAVIALVSGGLLPLLPSLATDHPALLRIPYSLRLLLFSHLNLRTIWTASLLWFSACMFSTFYVSQVDGAMAIVALSGISWAVACWVPFALVMEAIQTIPSPPTPPIQTERSPLLPQRPKYHHRQSTSMSISGPLVTEEAEEGSSGSGGTILGIHNLAIVVPQFGVSLVSTAIFAALDGKEGPTEGVAKPDVVWVLRYGGLAALLGAVATFWLIAPNSEKKYVRILRRGATGSRVFRSQEEEEEDAQDYDA